MIKIIRYILGVLLTLATVYSIWDYPMAHIPLALSIILYCAVLFKNRRAWLIILPALLPVSDMTLYSGRFLLSEFDILLMATLSLFLFLPPRQQAGTKLSGKINYGGLALGLMALSFGISTVLTLSYPTGENSRDFSFYHDPLNSIRVAKGFFWALLLWPVLRIQYGHDPVKTKNYFVAGILGGLFLAGIGILWERGVIDSLVHWQGLYPLLTTLLDFSTTYRITGLFAGMHVGGTAIDGYLIMAIAFCLYPFISHKSLSLQFMATLCLMLGIYGIMVTFSRGLYGGFILVLLLLSVMLSLNYIKLPHIDKRRIIGLFLAFVLATFYMVFLFLKGGYGATISGTLLILATAFTTSLFRKMPPIILLLALGFIFVAGTYGIFDSMSESKWHDNSRLFSMTMALVSAFLFMPVTYLLVKGHSSKMPSLSFGLKNLALFSLISSALWLAIIPPLMNTRMEARFSTLAADFSHRWQNWNNALSFREKGFSHHALGTGVGSFPRYYFFHNYQNEPTVHYRFGRDETRSYLAIGNGDFNITQKIPLKPHQDYIIRAKVKADEAKYAITLKLCPKHIIFSDRYTPQCVTNGFGGPATGQWQQVERSFNAGKVGQSGIFNWPVTLMVHNRHEQSIIQITDIEIIDQKGINIVANGNFRDKSDRWVMIRDFSHDAWHAKNIFIHIIFEQGYFGLFAFLFLISCALVRQYKAMQGKDSLAPLLIAAICGTLVVGMFGTIIDNPRVTTLYFLIILFGLLNTHRTDKGVSETEQFTNG